MLELRGVHAAYGPVEVLHGVDLVVPDDSVVALLGPNSAGKTTLLRVASGLLAPTRGRVVLDGRDITDVPAHRRAAMGVVHVPEGRGIFHTLTVQDNLRLQAPRGDAAAIDVATSALPRLGERHLQVAGTMSGGEQQMLALAHAYVADSSVVLLDEVSMGLAPTVVDDIFHHLRGLANEGRSLLLVEQYVARALELADYVWILDRGRVAFAGEAGELDSNDVAASYLGEGIA